MMVSLLRAVLILGGCTGVIACSQQARQVGSTDARSQPGQPQLARPQLARPQLARLCIAEGQPDATSPSNPDRAPWAITVSSEGGPCPHVREQGGPKQAYEVVQPPRHGQITQEARGGETVVSYWPERGYIGSDSFALRHPAKKVALPYLVGVVP